MIRQVTFGFLISMMSSCYILSFGFNCALLLHRQSQLMSPGCFHKVDNTQESPNLHQGLVSIAVLKSSPLLEIKLIHLLSVLQC